MSHSTDLQPIVVWHTRVATYKRGHGRRAGQRVLTLSVRDLALRRFRGLILAPFEALALMGRDDPAVGVPTRAVPLRRGWWQRERLDSAA
jgi:hypothetical protein